MRIAHIPPKPEAMVRFEQEFEPPRASEMIRNGAFLQPPRLAFRVNGTRGISDATGEKRLRRHPRAETQTKADRERHLRKAEAEIRDDNTKNLAPVYTTHFSSPDERSRIQDAKRRLRMAEEDVRADELRQSRPRPPYRLK